MAAPHRRKVFITGGTAGIGRATALLLAQKGHDVFTIGRDPSKKAGLLKDAREYGIEDRIKVLLQDLSDTELLEKTLPDIWDTNGPFDVLINNAGLAFDGVRQVDSASVDYLIKTNMGAYLYLSGFFTDRMIDHNIEGDIINVGSMSADTREGDSSGYVATKSGIQGFTEALRKEANPHNIRVSLVEPGAVGTDMQPPSPEEQRALQDKLEMLKAEDIAHAIFFILEQDRRVSISEIQIKPLRQFI
ncbi:MAG TPA: SDR family oxidoreductase [Sphingobacterium sp.]|nr:SDR family oxidoreductase [Sphingobacterium sp.]